MDKLFQNLFVIISFKYFNWICYKNKELFVIGKNVDEDVNATEQSFAENWEDDQNYYRNRNDLMNIPGTIYNSVENMYNDKTVPEYEKGYRYGANKDGLDEALENEVLKNELYMEPELNRQYR